MAPITLQASALSTTRVAGVQSRNVKFHGAIRAQRMAVRPAVAAADTEAAPEVPAAAVEAPAAEQPRQRRQGRPQKGPGPARTLRVADLEVGKEYEGAIVSIRDFGAFVNIGVNTDGLLHISQISTGFVHNVSDVVSVAQDVRVRVINIDQERGKFAVTMIPEDGAAPAPDADLESGERPQLKQQARAAKQQKRSARPAAPVSAGDVIKGKVVGSAAFGVFVEIAEGFSGLLHEREQRRVEGAGPLSEGDEVEVVVVSVRGDKVSLSQRSAAEIAQEKELSTAGVAVTADLPEGSGVLAMKLARLGVSADQFKAAVGAA